MKIGRTEKIWILSVLFFWVFYNFPGFPAYGDVRGCIIHGVISFVGTFLSVFVGCKLTEREYPLKDEETTEDSQAQLVNETHSNNNTDKGGVNKS